MLNGITILFFAFFLLLIQPFAAADAKPLLIVTENYAPYEMEQPIGGLQGFDYELITEIFKQLNYEIEIKFLPWKRVLHIAKKGKTIGIMTCAYRPEREEFITFSNPISEFTNGFYMRKGHEGPMPKILEDVRNQSVASIAAYESLKELQALDLRPMVAPTTDTAIKMLVGKRFDYLYVNKQSTDFAIKKMGLEGRFEFHPISRKEFYFCFSKQKEGVEKIVEEFNKTLFNIRENGTYDKIHDKYR